MPKLRCGFVPPIFCEQEIHSQMSLPTRSSHASTCAHAAFARYSALMRRTDATQPPASSVVGRLVVAVKDASEDVPQHGIDESYTLTVPAASGDARLDAATVYGALRGIETFSQLLRFNTTAMR